MNKIAVKRSDGGVSIVSPSSDATPETMLRDALAVEGYVSHREIVDYALPSDRTFRNAWTDDFPTPTIDVDLDKARGLIREKRNKALTKLDQAAYAESRKPNGNLQPIDIEAQRLRDIPQHPDFMSDDVDKLKALIDSIN